MNFITELTRDVETLTKTDIESTATWRFIKRAELEIADYNTGRIEEKELQHRLSVLTQAFSEESPDLKSIFENIVTELVQHCTFAEIHPSNVVPIR